MCRMNPNGSTRGIRTDPELQAGYGAEYSEIGSIRYVISAPGYHRAGDRAQAAARILRFAPLFDRHNRAGCFQDDILGGGTKHQFSNL